MSGPEEVDVLVDIIADGVRAKMLRPKCLARSTWLDDSYVQLALRVSDELRETEAELNSVTVDAFDPSWARRVFDETCDVVAFGGMLVDRASGRRPGGARVVASTAGELSRRFQYHPQRDPRRTEFGEDQR